MLYSFVSNKNMKQGILILLLLCITHLANAQLSCGLKSGLNVSDIVINNFIDPDGESDFNFKTGFHGGIFAIAEVGTRTGLSAELLYSNKGVNATNKIHLHYISLPVLVRYALVKKLYAEAGPEVGYLIQANSRYGNMSSTYDNKIDLGIDVGLQYNLLPQVIMGIRFNAGISSVIKNPSATITQGEKVRYQNRVLQLSVGYTLYKRKL